MDKIEEIARPDLVERLRSQAHSASKAHKMLADAKTARQTDAGGPYGYVKPEQTIEWQAADEIERLRAAYEVMASSDGGALKAQLPIDCLDRLQRWCDGKAVNDDHGSKPADDLRALLAALTQSSVQPTR